MKKSANKTADVALQQVRRLKAKGFYPSAELEDGKLVNHGEKELARTLFTYSESDAHMTRVIDAAVIRSFGEQGYDRCPSPHDIWALCRDINPTVPVTVTVNPDCELCEGTGFQFVQRPFGISGAARCENGCAVAGYEKRQEPITRRALWGWYGREHEGAAERRAASAQRRLGPAPKVTDRDLDRLSSRAAR